MRVIGTAGHVDHGKSTLVQALTGIHPDRLKEEQEREMTIDLGFAWMSLPKSEFLPNGEEVGIVDVPGHRDFIENMLSGIGGIDAALLVVAADEGVMPQTREHLAILDILQIKDGVVALTKVDLIDDQEWLDLVETEVRKTLQGTTLEIAPIVRVSARTRQGIPDLVNALSACLSRQPSRPDLQKPRLPIDRVFSMPGFGTVVTGTLVDGCLRVGDEVVVLSRSSVELRARVRGLQTHRKKQETAVPGSRTAVNLSGVVVDQIRRGDVLAHPGDYQLTRRMDVRFRHLPDASRLLRHRAEVKLFVGSAEVMARLRLLGMEELLPGQDAWLQLELAHPIVAVRGDRYILRRPSPGETLGGGEVVDPHPKSRYKRFSKEVLLRLESLAQGAPAEVLLQNLDMLQVASLQELSDRSHLDSEVARSAVQKLIQEKRLLVLDDESDSSVLTPQSLVMSYSAWENLTHRAVQELESYHRRFPLRRGEPREEFKSRMQLNAKVFNIALRRWVNDGILIENGLLLSRPNHQIRFNPQQQNQAQALLAQFENSPFSPPSIKECEMAVGKEIYTALVDLGELIPVSTDVVFRRKDFEKMMDLLTRWFKEQGTITVAQFRDHFRTSRKYALAFLEYLDTIGVTVRDGDLRYLKDDQEV